MANIFAEDYGTVFEIKITENGIAVDLSLATQITVTLRQQSAGTTKERPGVFKTDGTDGIVLFTVAVGDIPAAGQYSLRVNTTFPTGRWKTTTANFEVAI